MIRAIVAASLVFGFGLSGCATVAPVQLSSKFNPADFAWASARGSNAIQGSAVLRTVGGEVRSCGGFEVDLIPETNYSRERISHLYPSTERGFQPVPNLFTPQVAFAEDPPAYGNVGRKSACDAQGEFEFSGLPDGGYFIVVPIVWSVQSGYVSEAQGGRLMQRVTLSGGETKRVVLTQ